MDDSLQADIMEENMVEKMLYTPKKDDVIPLVERRFPSNQSKMKVVHLPLRSLPNKSFNFLNSSGAGCQTCP